VKRFDYSKPITDAQLERKEHRKFVGGLWETMGKFQLDYLVEQGLDPAHRFLDVGCGSLRAGNQLVDYLAPGNYYGIDINESLIDAGYTRELTDEQRAKLPRANLRSTDRFDADFGVEFDMAIAQSVFTHVSLNDIRLCLYRVAPQMKVGGRFFASFFKAPKDFPLDGILHSDTKLRDKFTEKNVFWYWPQDLKWASSFSAWEFRFIGKWGHPRRQKLVEFTRTG
jgi:SAM-dependent methyltransferase